MAREEDGDPERREAAARASGDEEEDDGEEGLSDSDDEDEDRETGGSREEEGEAAAAAGQERSEDTPPPSAEPPPAAVPAAAARDRSGRRPPGPPTGPPPCLPRRMPPSPDEEERERRRSRRRDLLLSQICFLALVALLLWSLSSMQEHDGECSSPAPSGRCDSGGDGTGLLGPRRPLPLGAPGARRAGCGAKTPSAPRRGTRRRGPRGAVAAGRLGRLAALGTLTCASWLCPSCSQAGGLVAAAVGPITLNKSLVAIIKVVLVSFVPVRLTICALLGLGTEGRKRAG